MRRSPVGGLCRYATARLEQRALWLDDQFFVGKIAATSFKQHLNHLPRSSSFWIENWPHFSCISGSYDLYGIWTCLAKTFLTTPRTLHSSSSSRAEIPSPALVSRDQLLRSEWMIRVWTRLSDLSNATSTTNSSRRGLSNDISTTFLAPVVSELKVVEKGTERFYKTSQYSLLEPESILSCIDSGRWEHFQCPNKMM